MSASGHLIQLSQTSLLSVLPTLNKHHIRAISLSCPHRSRQRFFSSPGNLDINPQHLQPAYQV